LIFEAKVRQEPANREKRGIVFPKLFKYHKLPGLGFKKNWLKPKAQREYASITTT